MLGGSCSIKKVSRVDLREKVRSEQGTGGGKVRMPPWRGSSALVHLCTFSPRSLVTHFMYGSGLINLS